MNSIPIVGSGREYLYRCNADGAVLAVTGNVFERPGTVYWSSTTSMYQPDCAWALYLDKGAVGVCHKAQALFKVWAVRNGHANLTGSGDPVG